MEVVVLPKDNSITNIKINISNLHNISLLVNIYYVVETKFDVENDFLIIVIDMKITGKFREG